MKLLIFEANLIWSTRLARSALALGHEATVLADVPNELPRADAAILNLADPAMSELVPRLRAAGIRTIGHAGHREKELLALGELAGCNVLVTNSQITYKLASVLEQVMMPDLEA